jgi:Tfp pilus assembly protein PilO
MAGLLLPAIGRLSRGRSALSEVRSRLAAAQALVEARAAHADALARARATYEPWEIRLGGDRSVAWVLEELTERANQRRLQLVAIQPKAEETPRVLSASGGLTVRELPIHLRLTGRYQQLGEFLGAVRGSRFLGAVRRVAVAPREEGSAVLTGDVELLVYLQASPLTL